MFRTNDGTRWNVRKNTMYFHFPVQVLLISVWETHKSFAVLVFCQVVIVQMCLWVTRNLQKNEIPDNIERNIMHRSTKRRNCWHLKARLVCAVVKKSMPKSPNYSLNIRFYCHCSCGNRRFLALTFVVIE